MHFRLDTERLMLRTLDAEHAPTLQDYLERNEHFFKPRTPTWAADALELYSIERSLREQQYELGQKRFLRFFIFHQSDKALQYILGDLSYSNIVMGPFMSCFLGYKVDQKAANNGVITEALRASNHFIFDRWGLHRIEANIMPQNLASLRVMEKLGFQQEGLAKNFLKINGRWEDHYRYALRAE